MESLSKIDNTIYDRYGEAWYTADDDPVALLRAENKVKAPWVLKKIKTYHTDAHRILDVGCGAGFLSNEFARQGFKVTGIDLSEESLKIAQAHDDTSSVIYEAADAYKLPYENEAFDVITAMDFLEHVEDPLKVVQECSRILKPGGLFFFHTFNRNFLSWLIVIKLVEWLIPKTPKNMHVLDLFIRPDELQQFCEKADLKVMEMTGIRPVFSSIPLRQIFSGRVPKEMRFQLAKGLKLSYMGVARKKANR
jgi:2-polyprenyl-6-hydroxyphenyl methylase / 3-demethylubiquinone-9 3-methyltransferase